MTNEKNSYVAKAKAGLCGLVAGAMALYSTGCATPNCIKERRYLASEGKLNSTTYTDVSVNDRETMVRAGITVNFGSTKDLLKDTAGACTAFGYGLIRPLYREFWQSDKPEKLEYSGLAIFKKDGYKPGRKAESAGEWTRYAAILAGILGNKSKGGSHDSTPASAEVEQQPSYSSSRDEPTTTTTPTTPVTPPTPPTPPTPVNPPESDGSGDSVGY